MMIRDAGSCDVNCERERVRRKEELVKGLVDHGRWDLWRICHAKTRSGGRRMWDLAGVRGAGVYGGCRRGAKMMEDNGVEFGGWRVKKGARVEAAEISMSAKVT